MFLFNLPLKWRATSKDSAEKAHKLVGVLTAWRILENLKAIQILPFGAISHRAKDKRWLLQGIAGDAAGHILFGWVDKTGLDIMQNLSKEVIGAVNSCDLQAVL